MLPLVDNLLALGRNFQKVGRDRDAIDLFNRLTGFRALPAVAAAEIHERLADLYTRRDNLRKARRHLTIALTHRPDDAGLHNRMATLIEADSDARLERAAHYHREAVRHARDHAGYWGDYAIYLLNTGATRRGYRAARRAFRLAPHDATLVGEIAVALRQAGLWNRARRLLHVALFRNAGDRRFQALWQRHQFAVLQESQQAAPAGPARPALTDRRVLPFVRIAGAAPRATLGGKTLRFDTAATRQPNLPFPKRLPN
jgi:tetratricopeptide (TPR) repeat protein